MSELPMDEKAICLPTLVACPPFAGAGSELLLEEVAEDDGRRKSALPCDVRDADSTRPVVFGDSHGPVHERAGS